LIDGEYKFVHYCPEHKEQVLKVLEYLWSYDRHQFNSQFEWKYEQNPNTDSVLGIVALFRGKVVGFRGYFADRFIINGCSEKPTILHPGDTCVHPEHRRKGLSLSMGKLAFEYDDKRYPLFMNMTCSAQSLPGYIKMRFCPLEKKEQLNKYSLNPLRLWRYRQTRSQKFPLDNARIQFGRIGDIFVSRKPMPEQMASVVAQQDYPDDKLCLFQDRSFFEWRYNNCTHKYVFYFLMKEDAVIGYVVVNVADDNQAAKILDYAQICDNAIKTILRSIIKAKHFTKLSIYSYGLNEHFEQVLSDLGFSLHAPWKRFIPGRSRLQEDVLPILIRPVKENFSERDFFINGLDVRDIKNWSLKPICSDSA
jgi:GNAT superfamily N-acetyltransferase